MPTRATSSPMPLSLAAALAALLAPGLACAQQADALPQGGQVVAGQASLERSERRLTVSQHSDRVILHWQQFDIGQDAMVEFLQPSRSAVALNRVLGGDVSRIAGQLRANGRVYLVNSAGVVFARQARVDVGQLVATTLDIADGDFLTGGDRLGSEGGRGPNSLGPLQTGPAQAGPVLPVVRTPGSEPWTATQRAGDAPGSAAAASHQLTLDAGANGHLRLGVDRSQVHELIEDGGLVEDEDGLVLTAQGANSLAAAVVARAAAPRARRLAMQDGRLWLRAAAADPEAGVAEDALD